LRLGRGGIHDTFSWLVRMDGKNSGQKKAPLRVPAMTAGRRDQIDRRSSEQTCGRTRPARWCRSFGNISSGVEERVMVGVR